MKKTILEFYQKYPKSEIIDFVKLIYQANFGTAHMIQDKTESYNRLYQEARQAHDPLEYPIFEGISEDFVRVHLAPYMLEHHSLYVLHEAFLKTCEQKFDNFDTFKKHMGCLMELTKKQKLSFDESSLLYFLQKFNFTEEIPSHSKSYHTIYKPSYRLINLTHFNFKLDKVIQSIKEKVAHSRQKNGKMIIAIEGPAGSGKTTISKILSKEYDAPIISMDDFFLPDTLKTKERLVELDGNVDYDRFQTEVLNHIHEDSFSYNAYNCKTKTFEEKTVPTSSYLIIEGVYSSSLRFQEYYDFLLYLDVKRKQQLKILKRRDENVFSKFKQEWLPKEDIFFMVEQPIKRANLIVQFAKTFL